VTVQIAFYLRTGNAPELINGHLIFALLSISLAIPIFAAAGLYNAIFRFSGLPALQAVTNALFIYGSLYASLVTVIGIDGVPRTIGLIQPLLMLLLWGSRALCLAFG